MNFEKLDELLERRDQQFVWARMGSTGGAARETKGMAVQHEIAPPLSSDDLEALESDYGHLKQLMALYRRTADMKLYRGPGINNFAFHIAHPARWSELKIEFEVRLAELRDDEKGAIVPAWISQDFIVFGNIPASGNCFIMPVTGDEAGSVYEFEWDSYEFFKEAEQLNAFIDRICSMDQTLLCRVASHMRYIDENTGLQWYIEKYRFAK